MTKAALIQQIVARLRESFSVLETAARASHVEATHESSKADNKYDTRGLEAAYLARGQSRQAREILDAIQSYETLPVRGFGPGDPIDLTALVTVDIGGARSTYFVGPTSGGLEIESQNEEILVITPQSPLGQSLIGKKAGQHWSAKLGGSTTPCHILSVS